MGGNDHISLNAAGCHGVIYRCGCATCVVDFSEELPKEGSTPLPKIRRNRMCQRLLSIFMAGCNTKCYVKRLEDSVLLVKVRTAYLKEQYGTTGVQQFVPIRRIQGTTKRGIPRAIRSYFGVLLRT